MAPIEARCGLYKRPLPWHNTHAQSLPSFLLPPRLRRRLRGGGFNTPALASSTHLTNRVGTPNLFAAKITTGCLPSSRIWNTRGGPNHHLCGQHMMLPTPAATSFVETALRRGLRLPKARRPRTKHSAKKKKCQNNDQQRVRHTATKKKPTRALKRYYTRQRKHGCPLKPAKNIIVKRHDKEQAGVTRMGEEQRVYSM